MFFASDPRNRNSLRPSSLTSGPQLSGVPPYSTTSRTLGASPAVISFKVGRKRGTGLPRFSRISIEPFVVRRRFCECDPRVASRRPVRSARRDKQSCRRWRSTWAACLLQVRDGVATRYSQRTSTPTSAIAKQSSLGTSSSSEGVVGSMALRSRTLASASLQYRPNRKFVHCLACDQGHDSTAIRAMAERPLRVSRNACERGVGVRHSTHAC